MLAEGGEGQQNWREGLFLGGGLFFGLLVIWI